MSPWWWRDDRSQHPQERDPPRVSRRLLVLALDRPLWPGDHSVGELGQVCGVGIEHGRSTDLGVKQSWGSKHRLLYARTSGEGTESFQFLTYTVTSLHWLPKCSFISVATETPQEEAVREALWLMTGERNGQGSGGWRGSHFSVSSSARDPLHTSPGLCS